ncbi:MAG: hypothetical protein R3E96_10515 [Planctomycetota bacterium]
MNGAASRRPAVVLALIAAAALLVAAWGLGARGEGAAGPGLRVVVIDRSASATRLQRGALAQMQTLLAAHRAQAAAAGQDLAVVSLGAQVHLVLAPGADASEAAQGLAKEWLLPDLDHATDWQALWRMLIDLRPDDGPLSVVLASDGLAADAVAWGGLRQLASAGVRISYASLPPAETFDFALTGIDTPRPVPPAAPFAVQVSYATRGANPPQSGRLRLEVEGKNGLPLTIERDLTDLFAQRRTGARGAANCRFRPWRPVDPRAGVDRGGRSRAGERHVPDRVGGGQPRPGPAGGLGPAHRVVVGGGAAGQRRCRAMAPRRTGGACGRDARGRSRVDRGSAAHETAAGEAARLRPGGGSLLFQGQSQVLPGWAGMDLDAEVPFRRIAAARGGGRKRGSVRK